MSATSHRVGALLLAREEIRALPRQTFALGAVGFVLAVLAPFASVVMDGPSAMGDYLLFLWVVAMLVVAVVLAGRVAAARRSRFVESLYTTPLEARAWLGGQVLVGIFLVLLVLVAQVPFLLVHLALVGVPHMLGEMLLAAVGTGAFAVAFGVFCGVIVGDAGPGAAAGIAGGVGFLSFFALIVHGVLAGAPPAALQQALLRVTALSPLTLVVDAAGIDIFDVAPEEAWRAWLGLAALVLGLGGAAWLAYTRAQGPLGWEPRPARAGVVALVAIALVVPVASASVRYEEVEEPSNYVLVHGEHTRVAFVPRGAAIDDARFTRYAYFEWQELAHGQDNELDALVMLLVAEGESPRGVQVTVEGSPSLQVVSGGRLVVADGVPDGRARMSEGFGENAEPTGPSRPVYRVPVTLRPVEARALMGSPGLVEVDTTFALGGRTLESHARMTLQSDVPGASLALFLAGTPLPLVALGTLVARRVRTR